MDVPFLIVGGHIFRDSDLTATEKEQWIAYIVFISVKLQNRCIYISCSYFIWPETVIH